MRSTNISKVPPGGRCECDDGSADGLVDGGSSGKASDSPDGAGIGELPDCPDARACVGEASGGADGMGSECDGDVDDRLVGTGLLRNESRLLILSRIDCNLRFGIPDEAIACRRWTTHNQTQFVLFVAACPTCALRTAELLIIHAETAVR